MVLLEDEAPKVLIVDDDVDNLSALVEMLDSLHLDLVVAINAKETYERIQLYDFDLILLDVLMPEIDGYEICTELKKSPKYKDIPIIFISALSSVEDKLKGFKVGCDDYITKPFIKNELIARVKLHLQKALLLKSLRELLRKSYHELYNPLSIINTSLELQTMKFENTKYLEAITVASRTLQIIYDDLYYSISNETSSKLKSYIDLSSFVKERIDYFSYFEKSKNINIDFSSSGNTTIKIRDIDIHRIVDNTLSNAIKYASSNSTVYISTVEVDDSVVLEIKNYGSEIKNPHLIFNQGYRENYETIGMGIGLDIVASICHKYNITAEVVSKDNETCFRYTILKD
ncbi:MAG: hybrid sensor histidine kinase/response regulator [Campylobacterales bacterium]